jgi:DNA-binding GntR family transcriptional regulator
MIVTRLTSSSATGTRPSTAPEFVLKELRRLIVVGDLVPGQPLRQDTLAERLGVSRVPVREALNTLESEGRVVHEPHRGYRVARLSLADLLEVYRIRQLLETEAVRTAMANPRSEVLNEFREAARAVERASDGGDLLAMTEANRRFHFVLVAAAGLPRLERIVGALWDSTEAYRLLYYETPSNRQRVEQEHAQMVEAFAAGETERLIGLLDDHRRHATNALKALLP